MYRPHTWVEIDLNNIQYNLNLIKSKLKNGSKIIGVVKADAYGFGAVEISRFLAANNVDMLAVSVLTEGIELRRAGITLPILLFNYVGVDNYDLLLHYDLTPTVYSLPFALKLNDVAKSWGKVIDVHLNVDTGMHRLGVLIKELPRFLDKIKRCEYLNLKGVYSHFSTADESDLSYTNNQLEQFIKAKNIVSKLGFKNIEFHIANSAAIMRDIACGYDYVRIGAALYGFNPSEKMGYGNLDSPLKNSLTFKTLIGHLKTLPKGAAISYGATYITHKDTKVATLPIGYADGLRRSLSNVGEVLIRGQRARIIGTVAMDQCMVDVTNIENVKVGDEVVVIGKQGQDEITLANVAKLNNTISYEVPALINRRVPRYYIKDNKTLVVRGHVDNI